HAGESVSSLNSEFRLTGSCVQCMINRARPDMIRTTVDPGTINGKHRPAATTPGLLRVRRDDSDSERTPFLDNATVPATGRATRSPAVVVSLIPGEGRSARRQRKRYAQS